MRPAPEAGGPPDPAVPAGRDRAGYPVVLDVLGRRCLVVGGGPVAARRARGLLDAGAVVTVVAPRVVSAIEELASGSRAEPHPGPVDLERRPYRHGEAGRFDLVVTATGDPAVDSSVVADARAAGVPVASATGDIAGTLRLPAVLRRGPVTVAVSTGGASPALAVWLRDRIAGSLPRGLETVAALLDEARSEVQASGRSTGSVDWATLLEVQVLSLVEAGRVDEARAALRAGWHQPGGTVSPAP
ncbi:MAG TPA: bifunctional precorrin-2 dehydrogenase/sirohydrochlorin ferrochelatase [Acidimicrobiales bacterium]